MKPRITLITLGVDDLDAAVAFYRDGLGLKTEGVVGREIEHGAVAFFELQGGLRLGLWPRVSIAFESGLAKGSRSATEFMIAHNVNSEKETDAVLAQAKAAGAEIIKPGKKAELVASGIPGAASACYDTAAKQLVIPMNQNNALAFLKVQ